jgi:hypothetical protein
MKKEKQKSSSLRSDKRPPILRETIGRRHKSIMGLSLAGAIFILLQLPFNALCAESITQFDTTFHWKSPNMILRQTTELPDPQKTGRNAGDTTPLRDYAYNFHFDSFGAPPPTGFLAKLEPCSSDAVEIDSHYIKFKKYGRTVPLDASLIPDWADPAKPYAVSAPSFDRVVVVYPYYFYQCKENKYFAELYSREGKLLQTFESLPTHVAVNNPNLLISPERSGCCESIRWDFRFYNIAHKTMTQLSCPEGFCGDVLFEFIDQLGHYLLIQEIVDSVSGVGAYLQTNIYLIDNQGNLAASGQTIFATKDNRIDKENISANAPYSLRNLQSVARIKNDSSWRLHYRTGNTLSTAQITGQPDTASPSALFLLADKHLAHLTNAEIKIAGYKVKQLPSLLIATPGKYMITTRSGRGGGSSKEFEVKPNTINKLPIEFSN